MEIFRRDCEFLEKLDLTVNFVDVDMLEASCDCLAPLEHLGDLYMTGNPCTDWSGFREYMIARVPQLNQIDGEDVTRTEVITATQKLPALQAELDKLAAAKRAEKAHLRDLEAAAAREAAAASARAAAAGEATADDDEDDDSSPWCPEERVKIAREVAAQKAEDDKKHDHLRVPDRDYEAEHATSLEEIRAKEEEEARLGGRVRARNEAKLEFKLEGEDGHGNVVLELGLPRFMDSSLIDVDAHPGHVSVVVRGKLFRIAWPEEVVVAGGKATRSSATGTLTLTMPKAKQSRTVQRMAREAARRDKEGAEKRRLEALEATGRRRRLDADDDDDDDADGAGPKGGSYKLADQLLETARLAGAVDVANIVDDRTRRRAGLSTDSAAAAAGGDGDDDDDDDGGGGWEFGGMRSVGERRAGAARAAAADAKDGAGGRKAEPWTAAESDRTRGRRAKPLTKQYRAAKAKKKVVLPGLIQELTGLDAELTLE
jgi:protein TilB